MAQELMESARALFEGDRDAALVDLGVALARAVLVSHGRGVSGDAATSPAERGGEEHRLAIHLGVALMMRSTSGRKPMSSMRSASSRTRILGWALERDCAALP